MQPLLLLLFSAELSLSRHSCSRLGAEWTCVAFGSWFWLCFFGDIFRQRAFLCSVCGSSVLLTKRKNKWSCAGVCVCARRWTNKPKWKKKRKKKIKVCVYLQYNYSVDSWSTFNNNIINRVDRCSGRELARRSRRSALSGFCIFFNFLLLLLRQCVCARCVDLGLSCVCERFKAPQSGVSDLVVFFIVLGDDRRRGSLRVRFYRAAGEHTRWLAESRSLLFYFIDGPEWKSQYHRRHHHRHHSEARER